MCQCIVECALLTGTRSAEGIMASGHVNRTNRPNTWLHRPSLRREDFPCQLGAVHTWHIADMSSLPVDVRFLGVKRTSLPCIRTSAFDRCCRKKILRPRPSKIDSRSCSDTQD